MKDGKLEEALAVAAMAVLVAITLLNVMTRYFTDESYAWTEELSVFLMMLMALAGASTIALRDRHIRIEFLFNRRNAQGEEVPRRKLKLFSCLVTSAVFSLMAALFVRWVWDQYKFGIGWCDLYGIFREAAETSAVIMLILGAAGIFSYAINTLGVADSVAQWVSLTVPDSTSQYRT